MRIENFPVQKRYSSVKLVGPVSQSTNIAKPKLEEISEILKILVKMWLQGDAGNLKDLIKSHNKHQIDILFASAGVLAVTQLSTLLVRYLF